MPTLLLAALYFPYFLHLDALPFRLWDESRLACNALDQYQNGFGLIVRFEGAADLWNTKPPLMIWLQAACMHGLGPNELAVRLPAALAGLATSLLLFFRLKGRTGAAAALILATMPGWVGHHAARTGDYDALLVFCTTGFLLYFYDYLESEKGRTLWAAAGFAAVGLMTKGVAAAMCAPGMALAALVIRPRVLLRPKLYFAVAASLLPLLLFYVVRESLEPGYLKAVWDNELGGRYLATLENHRHPWYFYFKHFVYKRWGLVMLAPLMGLLPLAFHYRSGMAKYLWITSLAYLFVVSGAQTKLIWYDLPVFPLFAGLTALGWRTLASRPAWVLAAVLFLPSYVYVMGKIYHPKELPWEERLYALPRYLKRSPSPPGYLVVSEYRQLAAVYARIHGVESRTLDDEFYPQDKILVSEDAVWERLSARYELGLHKDENGVRHAEVLAAR